MYTTVLVKVQVYFGPGYRKRKLNGNKSFKILTSVQEIQRKE